MTEANQFTRRSFVRSVSAIGATGLLGGTAAAQEGQVSLCSRSKTFTIDTTVGGDQIGQVAESAAERAVENHWVCSASVESVREAAGTFDLQFSHNINADLDALKATLHGLQGIEGVEGSDAIGGGEQDDAETEGTISICSRSEEYVVSTTLEANDVEPVAQEVADAALENAWVCSASTGTIRSTTGTFDIDIEYNINADLDELTRVLESIEGVDAVERNDRFDFFGLF